MKTNRLQVCVSDEMLKVIEDAAEREGISVSAWIRRAILTQSVFKAGGHTHV